MFSNKILAGVALTLVSVLPSLASAAKAPAVQVGVRPYFLVDDMSPSALKKKLQSCANGPFRKSEFSIGHRGAPLLFPEHTRESYEAAARMGAGVLECDVTFTKDKELVCRHSQCDLHTTTNILTSDLADKCRKPFQPATYDATGKPVTPASAECCTSDITLKEFKTLRGKMDASDSKATTAAAYQGGVAGFRTDLYAGPSSGTLMTFRESVQLFKKLGVKQTPELKSASVPMPFDSNGDGTGDYSQADYAQQLIDELKEAGIKPSDVYPQSFDLKDVLYWINNESEFGQQAVYLDSADPTASPAIPVPTREQMQQLVDQGVKIWAPPTWVLLSVKDNKIVPSQAALDAKAVGLKIITWTLERSGQLADGDGGWYYLSLGDVLKDRKNEGVTMEALDVLARQVGVLGVFADWPGTVTYYANCMKMD